MLVKRDTNFIIFIKFKAEKKTSFILSTKSMEVALQLNSRKKGRMFLHLLEFLKCILAKMVRILK